LAGRVNTEYREMNRLNKENIKPQSISPAARCI
jgi:hypothetical protein